MLNFFGNLFMYTVTISYLLVAVAFPFLAIYGLTQLLG